MTYKIKQTFAIIKRLLMTTFVVGAAAHCNLNGEVRIRMGVDCNNKQINPRRQRTARVNITATRTSRLSPPTNQTLKADISTDDKKTSPAERSA